MPKQSSLAIVAKDKKTLDDTLFEQGLPADKWVEKCVLGACLRKNTVPEDAPGDSFDKFSVLEALISEAEFTSEANRRLFATFRSLHDTNREIDYAGVLSELTQRKNLESVGGVTYLNEIDGLAFGTEYQPRRYFETLCRVLRKKSLARDLFRAFNNGMGRCAANDDPDEILAWFMDHLRELSGEYSKGENTSSKDVIEASGGMDAFLFGKSDDGARTMTPWRKLNLMTGGLQPGMLWILAARPSLGKSTMALQLTSTVAKQGKRVLFFSLEMAKGQLIRSLIAAEAGVNSQHIEHKDYWSGEERLVSEAAAKVAAWPIQWEEYTATDPASVRAKVETAMTQGPVGLVVVDYLQLMSSGNGRKFENKNVEVAHISRCLKVMAGQLGIPFVVLSQLNRDNAKEGRRPELRDLRDSGSIEQDPDVVVFLHRPDVEDTSKTEMIVAKVRSGPVGVFEIEFELPFRRFKEDLGNGDSD